MKKDGDDGQMQKMKNIKTNKGYVMQVRQSKAEAQVHTVWLHVLAARHMQVRTIT